MEKEIIGPWGEDRVPEQRDRRMLLGPLGCVKWSGRKTFLGVEVHPRYRCPRPTADKRIETKKREMRSNDG